MKSSLDTVAQSLFYLAWADGSVDSAEVQLISSLLEKLGLPLAQRLVMMDEAFDRRPEAPPEFDQALTAQDARASHLEMLVELCFADGQAHQEEIRILGDLAIRWGIGVDQLEEIRKRVLRVG